MNVSSDQAASSPVSDKPKRAWFQFSLATAILLMLIAGILLGVAVFLYETVHVAGEAEYTLHAMECVIHATEQFIKDHPGQWPQSWKELEKTSIPQQGMFSWPRQSEEIQKRVKMDFSVRLEDLAQQTDETFKAIQPIGPYYRSFSFCELIQIIQADVDQRNGVVKKKVWQP